MYLLVWLGIWWLLWNSPSFPVFPAFPAIPGNRERLFLNVIFQNSFEWLLLKYTGKQKHVQSLWPKKTPELLSLMLSSVFIICLEHVFEAVTESVFSKSSGPWRSEKTVKESGTSVTESVLVNLQACEGVKRQ